MKKYIIYLITILCMLAGNRLTAQTTAGTDFWLAFGQFRNITSNNDIINPVGIVLQIKIVTTNAANVTLTFKSNPLKDRTISIPAGTVHTIDLDADEKLALYSMSATSTTTDKSLHITSDQPVSVYACTKYGLALDATNVLPVDALGTDYYHISYNNCSELTGNSGQDVMMIIATENNTTVTYSKASTTVTQGLNKGWIWYLPSSSDMTGAHITSDKPVAYFVAHKAAAIPTYSTTNPNTEPLFQQLPPVNSWGTHFFVPDIRIPAQSPLLIRVVASQDGTVITANGGTVTSGSLSLNRGEFVTLSISNNNGCFISSNKPVGVCSYLLSNPKTTPPARKGGPAEVWIPPVEQTVAVTTVAPFTIVQSLNSSHYALIITSAGNENNTSLKVNNLPKSLTGTTWHTNSGYSYTRYDIPTADETLPHTFSNSEGLTVLMLGISYDDGYYYLGGSSMYNINMMFLVNGMHYQSVSGSTLCSGEVTLKAQLQYANSSVQGYLKWYINDIEQTSARDNLEWDTVLASGTNTIRMDVVDLNGQTQSVSTDLIVDILNVSIDGDTSVCVSREIHLTGSPENGVWKSLNTTTATVTDGTVYG
ncbi:MAG: IgGFc-binding protein, partial [Prevotellaceae bacterium]|nr:IgGFc-binding protein [Prevotellaceae bacterium]